MLSELDLRSDRQPAISSLRTVLEFLGEALDAVAP